MIEPTRIKLSMEILNTLSANEIIYAEIAGSGAMGNSGGVMIYTLREEQLICYETDVFTDESTYLAAEELLLKHIDSSEHYGLKAGEVFLDRYEGGMGNSVFVNRNVSLKTRGRSFIYNKDNKEYHILSSVYGVFRNVAYALENPVD